MELALVFSSRGRAPASGKKLTSWRVVEGAAEMPGFQLLATDAEGKALDVGIVDPVTSVR